MQTLNNSEWLQEMEIAFALHNAKMKHKTEHVNFDFFFFIIKTDDGGTVTN